MHGLCLNYTYSLAEKDISNVGSNVGIVFYNKLPWSVSELAEKGISNLVVYYRYSILQQADSNIILITRLTNLPSLDVQLRVYVNIAQDRFSHQVLKLKMDHDLLNLRTLVDSKQLGNLKHRNIY
jgi:hypothetical protein